MSPKHNGREHGADRGKGNGHEIIPLSSKKRSPEPSGRVIYPSARKTGFFKTRGRWARAEIVLCHPFWWAVGILSN